MLKIEKKIEDNKLLAKVSGKINTLTARQFDDELSDLSGVKELVLDFSELESISSAGLRILLALQCTMDEQGSMTVINVNDSVQKVFLLTGFTKFLKIE